MLHGAGEHVGDGFDAAVRMPGEAREIVGGPIVAEIVEQQKWICLRRVAKAEGASQFDAGALNSGLRLHDAFDRADGHEVDAFR